MRTHEEEVVNAYTHLISSVLSILFCIIFLNRATNVIHELQIFLLGSVSFWTFLSSFIYHNAKSEKNKQRNLVLDRVGIYLMIAASGISFSLASTSDFVRTFYTVAILLTSCALIAKYCFKKQESELYSIMSCLLFSVFCIMPLTGIFNESNLVNEKTISPLVFSMLCYCAGVVFYTIDSKKWAHTAWHLFVAAGYAGCFYSHLVAANLV